MFNKKKKYFKKMQKGVRKMIWDMEFKRFKKAMDRETVRQARDMAKSRLIILETRTKNAKEEEKKTDEFKRVEDDLVRTKKEIESYEEQLQAHDLELNGSRKTNQYPDGVDGIAQQLDALRALYALIPRYIKTL